MCFDRRILVCTILRPTQLRQTRITLTSINLNSTAPNIAQLNSVEIICNKARGVCHEAIAALFSKDDVPQISWQFLAAVISEFKIVRWEASGITAISAKPVADVELKIDVKASTATRRHQERKALGSQPATPDVVVMWQLE